MSHHSKSKATVIVIQLFVRLDITLDDSVIKMKTILSVDSTPRIPNLEVI